MTFQEFLSWLGINSKFTFWGIIVFLTSVGIEIVPKIKWNPWSSLIKWIGSKFNDKIDSKIGDLDTSFSDKLDDLGKSVDDRICELDRKVDKLQKDLSAHVLESENKNLQDIRRDILDFCNACMNKRRHTKEQFDFVIRQCDYYETYIHDHDIKNGVIEAAIKEIRRLYDKCIQEHSFLKEGEEDL